MMIRVTLMFLAFAFRWPIFLVLLVCVIFGMFVPDPMPAHHPYSDIPDLFATDAYKAVSIEYIGEGKANITNPTKFWLLDVEADCKYRDPEDKNNVKIDHSYIIDLPPHTKVTDNYITKSGSVYTASGVLDGPYHNAFECWPTSGKERPVKNANEE